MTQEKALQALHDENERLGLYKEAHAQPEEQHSCDKQKPWVGLTVQELADVTKPLLKANPQGISYVDIYSAIWAKLKEKNT